MTRQRSDLFDPRRRSAYAQGYSTFVRVTKIVLPLVALVLIGILIARLSGNAPQQVSQLQKDEKTTPGQIEIVAPKYEGIDAEGRSYTVTADRAERAMDAPDTVLLEKPIADITLQDKTWIAVRASAGSLDRTTESLTLKDGVTVHHDSGHELQMQDIVINLKDRSATSSHPVQAHGPMGSITAQGLSVRNNGDLIVFSGPATLTISKLKGSRG